AALKRAEKPLSAGEITLSGLAFPVPVSLGALRLVMPSHCAGRSTAATTFVLDTVRIPEQAHGVGQAVTDSRHPRTRGLAELVKVMARLGLSASATARLVGIARSSLHGILHQESLPSLRTAQKMRATLGIRVEWWSQAAR